MFRHLIAHTPHQIESIREQKGVVRGYHLLASKACADKRAEKLVPVGQIQGIVLSAFGDFELRVSTSGIRTIDKLGIDAVLADMRKRGEKV